MLCLVIVVILFLIDIAGGSYVLDIAIAVQGVGSSTSDLVSIESSMTKFVKIVLRNGKYSRMDL